MNTIKQDLSSSLPPTSPTPPTTTAAAATTNPPFFSDHLPWPPLVRSASWNLLVEPLEHSPMEWATSVVYLLDLDGADMGEDYPGFGRRL
jgi:hypothetical protein